VFLMIRLIPGDAVTIMLGANSEITPERLAELNRRVGLDRPIVEQYFLWAGAALRGDFGISLWTGRPVAGEILLHLWPTLELTLLSLLIGAVLAVPVGCLMAQTRGGAADVVMRVTAIAGLTIPSFWLGIVLILLLSSWAPSFASLGYVPFSDDPLGNLQRMALPAFALALPILANLSRLVRSAMLDALGQDYIRTARAKGLAERKVVYKHALRNALLPVMTTLGMVFSFLLGANVLVEKVFAWPGIGSYAVEALIASDYAPVQGFVLLMASIFVLVNLVVDLLYGLADPRVSIG
jgi:peptide/nickel transport system permease protein